MASGGSSLSSKWWASRSAFSLDPLGLELAEGFGDGPVGGRPPAPEDRVVGDLAHQAAAERPEVVVRIGDRSAGGTTSSASASSASAAATDIGMVATRREQPLGEPQPDHRRVLERDAGLRRQLVDAGLDELGDRSGQVDVVGVTDDDPPARRPPRPRPRRRRGRGRSPSRTGRCPRRAGRAARAAPAPGRRAAGRRATRRSTPAGGVRPATGARRSVPTVARTQPAPACAGEQPQHRPVGGGPGEVAHDLERAGVGGVDVVEDDEDRALGAGVDEHLAEGQLEVVRGGDPAGEERVGHGRRASAPVAPSRSGPSAAATSPSGVSAWTRVEARSTRQPVGSSSSATSSARRLTPVPASPRTITTTPSPSAVRAASRRSVSSSRVPADERSLEAPLLLVLRLGQRAERAEPPPAARPCPSPRGGRRPRAGTSAAAGGRSPPTTNVSASPAMPMRRAAVLMVSPMHAELAAVADRAGDDRAGVDADVHRRAAAGPGGCEPARPGARAWPGRPGPPARARRRGRRARRRWRTGRRR